MLGLFLKCENINQCIAHLKFHTKLQHIGSLLKYIYIFSYYVMGIN